MLTQKMSRISSRHTDELMRDVVIADEEQINPQEAIDFEAADLIDLDKLLNDTLLSNDQAARATLVETQSRQS